MQEGFWIGDALEPDGSRFHVATSFEHAAALDEPALAGALAAVAARHDVLRTTFSPHGEAPRQLIAAVPAPIELLTLDAAPLAGREGEAAVGELQRDARRAPLDVVRGPLYRVTWTRHGRDRHALSIVAHHLVTDDRSMEIWAAELRALLGGTDPAELPALPIQYADFAEWQRAWVRDEAQGWLHDYWARVLDGAPPAFELPRAPRAAAVPSPGALAQRTRALPSGLVPGLQRLGREQGATPFMVWAALLSELLARRSDAGEAMVGTTAACRTMPEIAPLIGCFANVLVLRMDVSGRPTPAELVERARRTVLGALEHQELPFVTLVEELNPPRAAGRLPLVPVGLQVFEDRAPAPSCAPAGVLGLGPAGTPFDVELALTTERSGGGRLTATYRADLYAGATVAALCDELVGLAERAVGDPSSPLRLAARPIAAIAAAAGDDRERLRASDRDTPSTSASAPPRRGRRRPSPSPAVTTS